MSRWDQHHRQFHKLLDYLAQVPAVQIEDPPSRGIGTGVDDRGWWVKFHIDIHDELGWNVVQEFGHVLNYLSLGERLPTVFKPVSPPPYMNGGPAESLSWVIECSDPAMRPGTIADWLEGRLPRPVQDRSLWPADD